MEASPIYFDILWILVGAILGGFISWIITYESERSKKMGIDMNQSTAHGKVALDIETCWRKITNHQNMAYYTVGHYGPFQDIEDEIGPGTRMERKGFMGGKSTSYIVVWNKPYQFAWGTDRYEWHDFIELKKSGAETQIFLRRKLYPRTPKWHEVLLNKFLPSSQNFSTEGNPYYLTSDRLERIIKVCQSPERD